MPASQTISAHRGTASARGAWFPWLFVAGLGLVIAVNGIMIAFAVDSFSGLETARPYERGVNYNQTLAAARAQSDLGWQVAIEAVPAVGDALPRPLEIKAMFQDRSGRGLDGMEVRALLRRPAAQGHDFEVPLAARGGGRYMATPDLSLRGQWELRIIAESDGAAWQSSRRILVP